MADKADIATKTPGEGLKTNPQKITCTVCAGWGKVEVYATPAHKSEVPCRRCQGTGKQHLMGVA